MKNKLLQIVDKVNSLLKENKLGYYDIEISLKTSLLTPVEKIVISVYKTESCISHIIRVEALNEEMLMLKIRHQVEVLLLEKQQSSIKVS